MTADDIRHLIDKKYNDRNAHVVMHEVRNGTGFRSFVSYIDVMVLHLWPSGGLKRVAFEIKVDRHDFLAELNNPNKNQWARDYCHEFWYVGPKDVIKEAEVPSGSGWMEPQSTRLITRLQARHNKEAMLDDLLLASIARSITAAANIGISNIRRELIDTDPDIRRWKSASDALNAFFKSKAAYIRTGKDAPPLLDQIIEVSATEESKILREQVTKEIFQLQNKCLHLWRAFTILSHIGLVETSESGDLILREAGEIEKFAIAKQRAEANKMTGYAKKLALYDCETRKWLEQCFHQLITTDHEHRQANHD